VHPLLARRRRSRHRTAGAPGNASAPADQPCQIYPLTWRMIFVQRSISAAERKALT
jgi:hypothetical protein